MIAAARPEREVRFSWVFKTRQVKIGVPQFEQNMRRAPGEDL